MIFHTETSLTKNRNNSCQRITKNHKESQRITKNHKESQYDEF